ncbi:hypothetical protein CANMA_004014 [Candida margitis]|uniref:uncharacterized protein n=1 Tax=Candida margitis TaxID=1775924 RepID=UPI002226809B|nr:uncharacterized protein CANMA_004014 [Candida margitis]KAI5960234.1 hypothetical protein CANMA_004014 [Candida margitis]
MKKQEPHKDAGLSERPRKQRSRTFNRHANQLAATSSQNSSLQRSGNESGSNNRPPSLTNARRTSQLGMNQSSQQPQRLSQGSQSLSQSQSQQRQVPSNLPRSARVEEAIALSDAKPLTSSFIKRNTSSLSPGNSEVKPKPFVVEIANIGQSTSQQEIEQLLQQTVSDENFKIVKLLTTNPAKVIVRVESLGACNNIIQALNGVEWKGSTLSVYINLEATEKTSALPGSDKGSTDSTKPEFNRTYIPPQYRQPSLSRKSNSSFRSQKSTDSSMSSFDSRRSNTADSRASSHASSIFSNYGHRHSSNLSTVSTDSVSAKHSVPSFIMNMMQGNTLPEPTVEEEEGEMNDSEQDKEQAGEEDHVEASTDEDLIEVPAGEGDSPEQLIKVSPTRLFVGNVPYSSNWASLRKFLIEKANEIDPDNGISILRVEIPISQMTLNEGLFYGQGTMHQPQVLSRSRGFAIVTTKDRASSQKLIELLNDVEFEGRALTIRFDKFPQFNNYTVQQLHRTPLYSRPIPGTFGRQYGNSELPMHNRAPPQSGYPQMPPVPLVPQQATNFNAQQKFVSTPSGPSLLSNLAFERNSLQQKIYYGNPQNPQAGYSAANPPTVLQPPQAPPNFPMSSSSPNQNAPTSGYYFMPYYFQAPPLPGSNVYQSYGVPLGATPAPGPVPAPIPSSQYFDPPNTVQQQGTNRSSGNTGTDCDPEEQLTREVFGNLSLNDS